MKPKKILVYSNNEFATLQMASLLNKKNYDVTIVIEYFSKNQSTENIIKIFSVFTKNIYLLQLNKKLIRFYLNSLFSFLKNFQSNKNLSNFIQNFHNKNNININEFDEIWFTNDTSSKFTTLKFLGIKKYFFHGLIDMRNLKKLNIFSFLIRYLESFIDRHFFHIHPMNLNFFNGNFLTIIDQKVLKKKEYKSPQIINFSLYKNFLSNFYANLKLRKKNNKKIILVNAHTFQGYDSETYKSYYENLSQIIYKFLSNKYNLNNYQIILKFKHITNSKNQLIAIKIFKRKFKSIKIYTAKQYYNNHLPLEIFAFKTRPNIMISFNTTGDSIVKKLLPNIKIYNIVSFYYNFWSKNKNKLTKSHLSVLKSNLKFNETFNQKFQEIIIK